MDIYPLFASNLIRVTFEDKKALNILKKIHNKYEYVDSKQEGSNGVFATANKFVLENYPEIKQSLVEEFKKINETIFKYDCEFFITTSWITKATKNTYSQIHSHRNSFYSGVLYFGEYPKNNKHAPIQFYSPIDDFRSHYVMAKEWNIANCSNWDIYPNENMLLFFPSYLKHRIAKHNDEKPRYSLAFNIVPIGSYGTGDSFYDTRWFVGK